MRGMRNIAIHEYFFVDLKIVRTTVKEDLPKLKQQIEALLHRYQRGKGLQLGMTPKSTTSVGRGSEVSRGPIAFCMRFDWLLISAGGSRLLEVSGLDDRDIGWIDVSFHGFTHLRLGQRLYFVFQGLIPG
jgi:hypothetical protein